ncbi:MAG: M3 family metallopeptidase, partial [Chloroflexi bacterium]|nr:M3 family metallopeptidase [Chloroflexota bacterium]
MRANNHSSPASSADGVAWDLSDLYLGTDDPKIDSDLDSAEARAREFVARYRGKLAALSAAELAEAVSELECITELADAAVIFAQLLHAAKSDDPARGRLVAHATERNSGIRNTLVFFELEWVALEDEVAAALMDDPALRRYRHFLETERRFKPHRLSEAEEMLLERKSNTGSRAFSRLFDEVTGRLVCDVEIEGETRRLNESETLALLYDPDRDTRRAAAKAMTVSLREQSHLLTYVMNTLVQDHKIDDELRSFPNAMASRNLANEISDRSVEALMESCVSAYPTVQRFYRLKKRLLGYDQLYDYDRYAPIADDTPECDWNECKVIVRDAYGSFAPEAAEIVDRFFEGNWIDAELRSGKRGGAFSASGPTYAHPYILANYTDRLRDVVTIAHELGHGIHQYLSRGVGYLQQDTPLTT